MDSQSLDQSVDRDPRKEVLAAAPAPAPHSAPSGGGTNPAQAWLSAPTAAPAAPAQDPRSADLWRMLMERASQGLAVDRNDPVIRQQSEAFSANQERARRNYISDVAEQRGPLANIQGERRMAAERAGIASGAFEAELVGREIAARRDEIAQALAGLSGRLTAEQEMALRQELAQLDAALQREGLSLQGELGRRGLDLQSRGLDLGFDQFLRQMAQRQYEFDEDLDYRYWMGV